MFSVPLVFCHRDISNLDHLHHYHLQDVAADVVVPPAAVAAAVAVAVASAAAVAAAAP